MRIQKFIDRDEEVAFLERKYASKSAEFIIIYGRRRVGKTELLLHFGRNKRMFYFLGRLESRNDTLKRFNNTLIEFFNDISLIGNPLNNWDNFFDYLAEKSKNERFILVIDEFPFLADKFPEVISILQDKWDSKLINSKIMIILNGSSIGMMEKYTLDYKSPLYGRRTGQWRVNKLKVEFLHEFFPSYTFNDLVILYSCLDTIPGYLIKFIPQENVWVNIRDKLLAKGEFLYEEIGILLMEEFRDPSNYLSILSAIASGCTTFNEINVKTMLDKSLLSKYLFILENTSIIEKILPVVENRKAKLKARGALYYLKDNFFDFWFRFVYPNKQLLEEGKQNEVVDLIKGDIDNYLGHKFELFIKESLFKLVPVGFTQIGKQWGKIQNVSKDKNQYEIDIVALNEKDKEILFGECKWKDKVNAKSVLAELIEKIKHVNWNNDKRKEHYAVFAKSFSKRVSEFDGKKAYCYDLKDIERLLKKKG